MKNVPLGWDLGLTGLEISETNTLAYYEQFQITDIKCFITLGPERSDLGMSDETRVPIL